MSVVTEQLEQWGCAFELLSHRQASTSIDAARALGVDAGEAPKTLAVRTSSGYALVVIPATRRLDLHLARQALVTTMPAWPPRTSSAAISPTTSWAPAAAWCAGRQPGVRRSGSAGHDTVVLAAGSQTESVMMRTEELFGGEQATTVPLVKRPERGSEDPIA